MREILFRGKRVDNGEWVYGYFVQGDDCNNKLTYILPYGIHGIRYHVIPESVGQYTGLKDKEGNKIFEGDIVKDEEYFNFPEIFVIRSPEWFTCDAFDCYGYKSVSNRFTNIASYDSEEYGIDFKENCVIIGNIHDNPELLRKE